MKRTRLFSILAALPAMLLPLAAAGQVASDTASGAAPQPTHTFKYEAYAGFSYTNLDQVNLSRHGLAGVKVGVTRDWGRFFGLTANADYFKFATGSGNPGNPSVYSVLAGPELHGNIYGNVGGLVYALLGVEHTGGEQMSPSTSFAGGPGIGLYYNMNSRWSVRATGERIGGSFSFTGSNNSLGNSPHVSWNARGQLAVVYHF